MLVHALIQHVSPSTQHSLLKTVSDKDIWYWPTGKVAMSGGLPRQTTFRLTKLCIGLSHFLNYCWGVLDQAQNGFDDVISAIYLVSTFTQFVTRRERGEDPEWLPEVLPRPCFGELADLTACGCMYSIPGFHTLQGALRLLGNCIYSGVCGFVVHQPILWRCRVSHGRKCR